MRFHTSHRTFCATISVFILAAPFAHAQQYWTPIGLDGKTINCLAATTAGTIFAGTGGDGIYRSSDGGSTWTQVFGAGTDIACITVNSRNFVYAGSAAIQGLMRSADNGDSWSDAGGIGRPVTAIAMNSAGHLYAGTAYITVSTNDGDTWLDMPWFKYTGAVQSIALNWAWDVFAITKREGDFVVRSTSNSNHWDESPLRKGCRVLAVTSGGAVFAGADSGMYRSDDKTDTWSECTNGLTTKSVRSIVFTRSEEIVAGTAGGGVFISNSNGSSWTPISSGLGNLQVISLAVDSAGRLYAGTAGGGVYRSTQSATGIGTEADRRPPAFELQQNHPNPVTAATTISFTLPERTAAVLKVYDALGREVTSLANGELAAGMHSRQWTAQGLPDGIYFFRLQAGRFSETRKLLLRR